MLVISVQQTNSIESYSVERDINCAYVVEDENGEELEHRVGGHVLEEREARDERAAALAQHALHAPDVQHARREHGGHRAAPAAARRPPATHVAQRNAHVRAPQCACSPPMNQHTNTTYIIAIDHNRIMKGPVLIEYLYTSNNDSTIIELLLLNN